MVSTACLKAARKKSPHQEAGNNFAPASLTSTADSNNVLNRNNDVRPEEQSRNDRPRQESSEVGQAPSEGGKDERSTQDAAAVGQPLCEALPTMPSLPPSKRHRHSPRPSHSARDAALIRSFKNTEKSKQVAKIPFARLGLPPPPKLANMLRASSSLAWTKKQNEAVAPSSSASSIASSTRSYENVLPKSDSPFECLTRSYFNDDEDLKSNKRLRTAPRDVAGRDETKRLIEAAMALSTIGQDFCKPEAAFVAADEVESPKQALLAPPALCPSLGL